MPDAYRMMIDGEWLPSEAGAAFQTANPATGDVNGTLPEET